MNLRSKTGDRGMWDVERGMRDTKVPGIRWFCLVLSLALLLGGPAARAAQADGDGPVTATLADPSVEVGETTRLQISVANAQADSPPLPPVVEGLNISYVGAGRQESFGIINGQMTRRSAVNYSYVVRTTKAGRFTIPAVTVQVGGVAQHTAPVVLTVEDPGTPGAPPPGQTLSAELVIPKKTAYVGESFLAELRVAFGLNVNILAFDEAPQLAGEGFSVQKFTQARPGVQVVNNVRSRTATYRTAITGVKTGTLNIGPVVTTPTVQLQITPGRRVRRGGGGGLGGMGNPFGDDEDSPFGNFFGNGLMQRTPPQQVKVTAAAVPVEILPLPAGQPETFSGGIGQFKLAAEATPRRVQTGDPVTVRLVLTGQGNFARANAPVLTDDKGLRTYPPTSQFKADDDVGLSGTKIFEQVVIADAARETLPSFHFDYLDPATGKYATLETGPVAVKIEGGAAPNTPAVSTAPGTNGSNTPAATPTPTPQAAQDIFYIRNDFGPARSRAAFLPFWRRPVFWWAQLVPLTALLALGLGAVLRARGRDERRRRQSALQRQQGELGRVLRRETTSRRDFYSAAAQLAQLRVAGQNGDTDQRKAVEARHHQGPGPEAAAAIQEIFHRHDELAYSGGAVAEEPVPADERRTVLATLENLEGNTK